MQPKNMLMNYLFSYGVNISKEIDKQTCGMPHAPANKLYIHTQFYPHMYIRPANTTNTFKKYFSLFFI